MRSMTMLVGIACATPLVAQEPTPAQTADVTRSAAAAFQLDRFPALEARVGGSWQVHWNQATKTPEMVYGTGIALADWRENTLAEARRHANQALVTYGDVLKLGNSEFRESIGARMGRSWSFVYDQYFRGLPCIGGRADVRVNMRGVIGYLGSVAYQLEDDFNVIPTIAQERALAQAWIALGEAPTGVDQPKNDRFTRLVIWADLWAQSYQEPKLAWEVPISNVDRNGFGKIGRYFVDANTGAVLGYTSDKHECSDPSCHNPHHGLARAAEAMPPVPTTVTVMAWTRTGLSAAAPLVNTPMAHFTFAVPGLGNVTTDANGQVVIDIAAPVNLSVTAFDGAHMSPITGSGTPTGAVTVNPGVAATLQLYTNAATPEQAAHANTYFWVDTANEWVRSIVGNVAQMTTADAVSPRVNTTGTCNAFYTGNTINFYPTGGSCNNTAFSTVVVHEWGHGLDERFGGISNATGDGLSEGWGDIFGMFHPLADNRIVGEFFFTSGGFIRDGMNTKMYGTQTEVHAAGEIWMGFAWRLRENLRAALGTPQAVAISNDIVVGSIVANATNQANAVTQVFVADDDDGNLANGTPHYAQLSAAAIAKGMPYPQLQIAFVNHTALGNTTSRFTPRVVQATAGVVSSGSITEVRLVYAVNGGAAATRRLIPNGQPNGYHGMLPGISTGTVSYHLEATHSGGTIVRTPAAGEISYTVSAAVVGPFAGFYLENFETTAPGWTHVRVSGTATDDWQLGAPNGKTGTSQTVTWADPAAAVSSRVYGTDLGAGTANGAYPANMNYYLQSPVINCSGRTGCHLRFRRWLTVEEATYDHANVRVNGQLVWANAVGTHHRDTAWTTFEVAIPMADNNPSVTIRFELITDAGLQLGGWNIDDVEVGTRALATLPATLQMLPEQAASSVPMTLTVTTQGPQPFVLAIGDAVGPTIIPGLPPMLVGGSYFTLGGYTDATGNSVTSFSSLSGAPATGLFWYSQVLTLDGTLAFVTSNQHINLFTP